MPEIGQGMRYVDRGEAASNDFSVGDFTTDGTWNDLDLSSIVPKGSKAVHLKLMIADGAVNSIMQLRKNGNTGVYNVAILRTYVANISISGDFIVALDENAVIEYNGSNLAFNSIYLHVKGWFK